MASNLKTNGSNLNSKGRTIALSKGKLNQNLSVIHRKGARIKYTGKFDSSQKLTDASDRRNPAVITVDLYLRLNKNTAGIERYATSVVRPLTEYMVIETFFYFYLIMLCRGVLCVVYPQALLGLVKVKIKKHWHFIEIFAFLTCPLTS